LFFNLASLAAAPNLIVNGSFESGFSGWQGTWGYYDHSPNPVSGSHVGVLIDISHSSVGQTMYQHVPTTPGLTYELTFALRLPEFSPGTTVPVVGDSRGGSTTISLRIDDVSIASIPVVNRNTWSFYDYDFTATQSSTRINFFNPSSLAWPFIDAVSMTVVPEPQSAVLISLGWWCAWTMRPGRYRGSRR
jgi:hypothetical protein